MWAAGSKVAIDMREVATYLAAVKKTVLSTPDFCFSSGLFTL
jgi:hypothetical protein